MPRMSRTAKIAAASTAAIVGLGVLVACGPGASATQKESKVQGDNYSRLVAAEPAHTMATSPSRATINFWIDTWGKDPNKLAYVYLQASNGQLIGYYVFKGLPVSYCAALTPTYKIYNGDKGDVLTPAPSIDGVYYSGGQCAAYYGRDASTNAYIEYTIGTGISALIYDRPLPSAKVAPLGFTNESGGKAN